MNVQNQAKLILFFGETVLSIKILKWLLKKSEVMIQPVVTEEQEIGGWNIVADEGTNEISQSEVFKEIM